MHQKTLSPSRLLVMCLVLAASAGRAGEVMALPGDTTSVGEAANQDVIPSPTDTLVPTQLPPQPTQAQTATSVPTAVPSEPPTEQPRPTETVPPPTAPAAPTAYAVATSTATATATAPATEHSPSPSPPATATTTATPSASATVTTTPLPAPRSASFSVQSVSSGSGCRQTSGTDIVETTGFASFSCDARTGAIFVSYGGTISAATAGWQYRVNAGTWISTASSIPTQLVVLGSSIATYTIDVRPTSVVVPGSSGGVTVAVTVSCALGCGPGVTTYTATLSATRLLPAPTASDLQLICTPATITTGPDQSHIVTCVYSGKSTLGARQAILTRLVIPAPAGWAIAGAAGSVTGTTLSITPNATISYNTTMPLSYSFTYSLTPSCTASVAAQAMTLTSLFAFGTASNITGAGTTGQVKRSSTSTLAMAVRSSSMNWNQTVSFLDTTVTGNLTYRIVASGCTGWSVTVSGGPYTYAGPNNGMAIPAANLLLTNAGDPVVIAGSATGVTRKAMTGTMSTSRNVLGASIGAGNGTYEQQLDFSLAIPGQSRAGTYQSTITLTSAAAP